MTDWILFVYVWGGVANGGPAMATFKTKKACEYALQKISNVPPSYMTVRGYCLPESLPEKPHPEAGEPK